MKVELDYSSLKEKYKKLKENYSSLKEVKEREEGKNQALIA